MKNMKNLIAIAALVTVLGTGNALANDLTIDTSRSNQQCTQKAQSWFDHLLNYVSGYLTDNDRHVVDDQECVQTQAVINRLAVNHNETLVRDDE